MRKLRQQLTLFPDPNTVAAIEQLRQRFNPQQFKLIKAHVTLCREDELQEIEKIKSNLLTLPQDRITLEFGPPIRFAEGQGVLLPVKGNTGLFDQLRATVLKGVNDHPRKQEPHITLMHPRNAVCTDSIFELISNTLIPSSITFSEICLIEQADEDPWRILNRFGIDGHNKE